MSFTTVPFKAESEHGITHAHGMAKFSSAGIVLEFEAKILGLLSQGIKEIRLPILELLDVNFKKGLWRRSSKIVIRLRSITKLAGLPNSSGKIILKIAKDDFERASDAVERLQKEMAEQPVIQAAPPRSLFDNTEDDTQELRDE
ncbi:MAG: hypothetical protein IPM59_06195 [Chloracidobacterium sp.]|nr:hypothetical protein [Chloracidobacterium sp.]